MKFFLTFVALVAVAVASPVVKPVSSDIEALEAIVAAINSPNTDPATAELLEQQLQDILGAIDLAPISVGPAMIEPQPIINPEPIAIGPALIEPQPIINPEPIAIGPALIDFPLPDGGAITPVAPSPVVVGPIPEGSSPLVQIVVNINQAESSPSPVPVGPVIVPVPVSPVIVPTPVQVVDSAPIPVEPVQVVEVAPTPVQVVEVAPVPAEPVLIGTPVLPEPVIIGTPVLPSPAITLPEELN